MEPRDDVTLERLERVSQFVGLMGFRTGTPEYQAEVDRVLAGENLEPDYDDEAHRRAQDAQRRVSVAEAELDEETKAAYLEGTTPGWRLPDTKLLPVAGPNRARVVGRGAARRISPRPRACRRPRSGGARRSRAPSSDSEPEPGLTELQRAVALWMAALQAAGADRATHRTFLNIVATRTAMEFAPYLDVEDA